MTNDKRYILCWVLILAWVMALPYVMRFAGIDLGQKKPAVNAAAKKLSDKDQAKEAGPELTKKPDDILKAPEARSKETSKVDTAKAHEDEEKSTRPRVELLPVAPVLGSVTDRSPAGYRLEVHLTQKGAGIEAVLSSRYDAEFEFGQLRKSPLQLIGESRAKPRPRERHWPASLTMTLKPGAAATSPTLDLAETDADLAIREAASDAEDILNSVIWEVVRDDKGNVIRTVTKTNPETKIEQTGQAVVFRTKADNGVIVTKTFRLFPNIDGLEVTLRFESPEKEQTVVYNLLGPHGIPIEGEWYTGTFRDVVFGQIEGNEIKPVTTAASEIATETKPTDNTKLPLAFAGVENQYFATLIEQAQKPIRDEDRLDSKATALLLRKDEAPQKSEVGVQLTSRPFQVGPNLPVEHTYRIFAGPKTAEALKDYHAEILATYRKGGWFSIPFAPYLARYVITPTLGFTYALTERVSRLFGGNTGNYGVAIILLTILVRAIMFPLGRKQALSAQKMQLLQPHLKELQEKFKEDKERLTKETFALYKKHGVNPVGGCLPALIQLPIFVGLWQALNTSFKLRHASFLWIRDLSAPDMLFHLPFEIPFLGNWFNVLPFVVVALMLVQTKLFAPPATTPEAEMQQKTMSYMMVFMGFMFYKVPSGLGLYFITSSGWAICERLLLPKLTHAHLEPGRAKSVAGTDEDKGPASRSGGGKGGPGGNGAPGKPPGKLGQFWDRLLDEARKDPTYRKMTDGQDGRSRDERGREERGRDPERPRPKPRKR